MLNSPVLREVCAVYRSINETAAASLDHLSKAYPADKQAEEKS